MCMARRKAALPSMVQTPRPSLAELRAAPFLVNALEQDIRYRAEDCEHETDADRGEPQVSVDREGQDRQSEVRSIDNKVKRGSKPGLERNGVGRKPVKEGGNEEVEERGTE